MARRRRSTGSIELKQMGINDKWYFIIRTNELEIESIKLYAASSGAHRMALDVCSVLNIVVDSIRETV